MLWKCHFIVCNLLFIYLCQWNCGFPLQQKHLRNLYLGAGVRAGRSDTKTHLWGGDKRQIFMRSVSVSVWELFSEFTFRKIRPCFEKCAAYETHRALWGSGDFANAFWISICALGRDSLQVPLGRAPFPCCSPHLCCIWWFLTALAAPCHWDQNGALNPRVWQAESCAGAAAGQSRGAGGLWVVNTGLPLPILCNLSGVLVLGCLLPESRANRVQFHSVCIFSPSDAVLCLIRCAFPPGWLLQHWQRKLWKVQALCRQALWCLWHPSRQSEYQEYLQFSNSLVVCLKASGNMLSEIAKFNLPAPWGQSIYSERCTLWSSGIGGCFLILQILNNYFWTWEKT